jgi:predicted LPLAT superfamily acyltransferase
VPFFGQPVRLPTAPYLAALAANVPLFLCLAPRLGMNHYAIEFSMLHDGSPVRRGERSGRIDALARHYASTLEDFCRRSPYNWFNFYDIWRQ